VALEIIKASLADMPIVANLVELYIYDLNEIAPNLIMFELDNAGKFGYPRFQRFWQDADCGAYLFKFNGKYAGFCLTHGSSFYYKEESARVIGEFGILKMYRNQGLGFEAAKYVMRDHPGFWEMRVIDENVRAIHFWGKVLQDLTRGNYVVKVKHDYEWVGKVFVGKVE